MNRSIGLLLCVVALSGCGAWRESRMGTWLSDSTAGVRASAKQLTTKTPKELPPFVWASAAPSNVTRGEVVTTTMPAQEFARFAPLPTIQLVSSQHAPPPAYQITHINDCPVTNCSDLLLALDETDAAAKDVQVDFVAVGGAGTGAPQAVKVPRDVAMAMTQSIAPDQQLLRVVDGGQQWLVCREGSVRAGILVRVERTRRMMQLVLTLSNFWGHETLLPLEVRASCDGKPLRCLRVQDTLELMYGKGDLAKLPDDVNGNSFAAISDREDYLVPTNYGPLYEQFVARTRNSMRPVLPAVASVEGESYPGPAILGDARALTGFGLQKQLYRPDGRENTGWLFFAGSELANCQSIEIDADFGAGLRHFQFHIPTP